MKQSELKSLSTSDLREKLVSATSEYTKTKITHSVSPIDNPMRIREMRKNIARMNTELQVRLLQENNQ